MRAFLALSPCLLFATLSCTHAGPSTGAAPAAAPPAAATAGTGAAAGGRGGQGGRGGRGTPLTPEQRAARRDSLAGLRDAALAQLMTTIAGRENEPAGTVFKNVQLMKDMTAKDFLVEMDSVFGRALNTNCTSCHTPPDYASDTRNGNPINGKARARIMITMVNAINKDHLSKLPAGRSGNTPTITCITCHRGVGGNPGRALMP